MNQRVSTMGNESKFAQLGNATQIPGTQVALSMPAELPLLNEGVDPQRVKIPFADLPERKATFEGAMTDAVQGKQHYYCYVIVADPNAGGGTDAVQLLANRVRAAVGNVGQPVAVTVPTPTGQNVTWQKSQTRFKQSFYYLEQTGKGRYAEMDGLFEVWSRRVDEANALVAIAWRVPTVNGQDFVQLDQKANLVAGSLVVKP